MKALIITSEYYGAPNRIGSHHLARQFANRGIDVFVVSFPVSPFYYLNTRKTHYYKRKVFSHGFVETENHIKVYVPNSIIPPIPGLVKHLPFLLNHWHKLTIPGTRKILAKELGSGVDFVLTDSVFFPFIKQFVRSPNFIFRVPDYLPGFWGENKALLESESTLFAQADLVVTSSRLLQQKINKERGVKARYLPNGVGIERFELELPTPAEYQNSNRPRAIYVGALKNWFNLDLLTQLADIRPNWDFFIIGGYSGLGISNVPGNIYFLGEKSQQECVPYMQHANAGIIPFKNDTGGLVSYINPIKLYEYLAAGIPVVSTHWKELDFINAPISIADSPNTFGEMLDNCLDITATEINDRKHFVKQFDWSNISSSLLKMIETR